MGEAGIARSQGPQIFRDREPEASPALINPFGATVGREEAYEYERIRPSYPSAAYEAVLAAPARTVTSAVDIGAGTGQFTRGLVARGIPTVAVEPSDAMRDVLVAQKWAGDHQVGGERVGLEGEWFGDEWAGNDGPRAPLRVIAGTAENTGLPANCADVVVWAQCSHWLDIPRASAEAARILRRRGALAVVAHQLAVEIPWVHRLSRIMRSGDVVRRDRTPPLGSLFEEAHLTEIPWEDPLTVQQIMHLARTRSSYLAATPARREKMQDNLRWYLLDHLGYDPDVPHLLPYTTFVWTARVRG